MHAADSNTLVTMLAWRERHCQIVLTGLRATGASVEDGGRREFVPLLARAASDTGVADVWQSYARSETRPEGRLSWCGTLPDLCRRLATRAFDRHELGPQVKAGKSFELIPRRQLVAIVVRSQLRFTNRPFPSRRPA